MASVRMNGPVPARNALRVKSSPPASTALRETIIPARSTRLASRPAKGAFSLKRTVEGSTTSTVSIDASSPLRAEPFAVRYRSMFHFTESASNAVPSWYVTFFRSESVTVLSPSENSHFSASQGMILPAASIRTRES